jgi:hypothetical protein
LYCAALGAAHVRAVRKISPGSHVLSVPGADGPCRPCSLAHLSQVICTDERDVLLSLCTLNRRRNLHVGASSRATVHVRQLCWGRNEAPPTTYPPTAHTLHTSPQACSSICY